MRAYGFSSSNLLMVFFREGVLLPYRLANLIALVCHGLGHAILLWLLTFEASALSPKVFLEGLSVRALLQSLVPGNPLPQQSIIKPGIPCSGLPAWKVRLVSGGGITVNLLTAYIAMMDFISSIDDLAMPSQTFVTIWMIGIGYFLSASLMAMASDPDLNGIRTGRTNYWACGPAFAIRCDLKSSKGDSELPVSPRLQKLVEILAREASTRGGQSGGFSIIANKRHSTSIIFDKVVKGKREDIVNILMERLAGLLSKAHKEGYTRPGGFEAILLHLRYATGGATHWHNAQPHWYEHYESMIHHRIENGGLVAVEGEVFNMIAHNGDMDGVYLEVSLNGKQTRRYFTQQEARVFFVTAMPWSSSEGNSDSRSVAEWVDFHLTQGLSLKALRYAYFTAALDFNKNIVTGDFDASTLLRWADIIDQAMVRVRKEKTTDWLRQDPSSISMLTDDAKLVVRNALLPEVGKEMTPETAKLFLEVFEDAFYRHDLTWVMRRASRDMVGEFALMVCTTLEPRMGVFSLTQAFSIGHNLTRGEIFGSAEPLGVTTALHQGSEDDDAYQIYLEDGQYATIEYNAKDNQDAIKIFDRAPDDDDLKGNALVSPRTLKPYPAVESRSNWFPVNHNPKITRIDVYTPGGNEIAKDLKEIPFVLKRVVNSFEPGGENYPAMKMLGTLIFANLSEPERNPEMLDLVLYGVDFNQDLVSEFSLALRSILPGLRVRAENSGNVLKEMKRMKREGIGQYGATTIFLGVSNSAQTQSTLAVARNALELVGTNRCFVLSQNLLNSMSQAIGQGYQPDDPLLPNTFMNLSHLSPDGTSGRRRAEAATIVPVATQAVLTEILINLTQLAIQNCQVAASDVEQHGGAAFEMRKDLNITDIKAFREFRSAIYEVDIPNRVGCNAAGELIDSPDMEALEREATARAENQVEFVRSYAIFSAYIIIATVFGVPVFAVLLSPLSFISFVGFAAHVLDAALFLSALWLIHLGLRKLQGRATFERIGARAEVFIDRKYIARIVERYNATLFSNAPAFLTPFFYWADTVQDALHRYGIRAHRGVVTIHRTPDERMGIEEANNAAEENMVYAQLGGIFFNRGQPQSRDKVRRGSFYENPERPYQTILSDSLTGLRARYERKLSPEALRLINRRLIDLADGIITEFVIGYRRKEIVNQSIWSVISWLPGAGWLYDILLRNNIDLMNMAGEADTANQAQIQSTKHPVSPMDIHLRTMEPRSTFCITETQTRTAEQPFAVIVFVENGINIRINMSTNKHATPLRYYDIRLIPGNGRYNGQWISETNDEHDKVFKGAIETIGNDDFFVIYKQDADLNVSFPMSTLNATQRSYITEHCHSNNTRHVDLAA